MPNLRSGLTYSHERPRMAAQQTRKNSSTLSLKFCSLLSKEQIDALSPRNTRLFAPNPRQERSTTDQTGGTKSFHGFPKLPAELVLRVLGHVEPCELLYFFGISKVSRQLFLAYPQNLFENILECQFSEFAGCFGSFPGFIANGEPLIRTDIQQRNLDNAFKTLKPTDFISWQMQGLPNKIHIRSAFDFGKQGGWYYLALLAELQHEVRREADSLVDYLYDHVSANGDKPDCELDIGSARVLTVCHEKMSWEARDDDDDDGGYWNPQDTPDMALKIKKRLEVFQAESADIRDLILSTLNTVIRDIIQEKGFDTAYWPWLRRYQSARLLNPRLSDVDIRKFASNLLTGLIFDVLLVKGISSALELCVSYSRHQPGLRYQFIKAEDYTMDVFREILDDRLMCDEDGVAQGHHKGVVRGLLWANGLEYDAENMFLFEAEAEFQEESYDC